MSTGMESPPTFTTEEALECIHNAVAYAEAKFPVFSYHPAQAATILMEEVGKYARAVNRVMSDDIDGEITLRDIQEYAASVGAVSVRILKELSSISYKV